MPYTPYQPEIAQGRLESLVNFQTMVMSLTGMDIANASLLDEATAAAEAMVMAYTQSAQKKSTFLVDSGVSPQTLSVLRVRAKGFGMKVVVGDINELVADESLRPSACGVLVQYPDVNGAVKNFEELTKTVHGFGGLVVAATDLLALTMLKPPGEWGADIALGNSARFGVPPGYGGPHAAFFAVTDKLKRKMYAPTSSQMVFPDLFAGLVVLLAVVAMPLERRPTDLLCRVRPRTSTFWTLT